MKGQQVKQKMGGNMEKKLMWGLLFLCFTLVPVFAQWEPEQRLTFNGGCGFPASNAWGVGAKGDTVHVVWSDPRDGWREIYYKRSLNGGGTWGPDTRLTYVDAYLEYPSVAVSGNNVHIVWSDWRHGYSNKEVYYKRSTDAGITWGADIRLTDAPEASEYPCVAVSGSNVYVVWQDSRNDPYSKPCIYYKCSTDAGTTWGADIRLTNNPPTKSRQPSIAVSGSNIHVVWNDFRDNNWETYYKRSTDAGITWGPDIRFTNNVYQSLHACVAVSANNVHVVWYDDSTTTHKIHYKRSQDGGTTWGATTILSAGTGIEPSIAVTGSNVHVAWYNGYGSVPYNLYYKRSTNGGTTWEPDTRLTDVPGWALWPSVAVSGSRVHVVWMDFRHGSSELYYRRNPPGQPVITHRPDLLTFNYDLSFLLTEKYVMKHSANAVGERLSTIIAQSPPDEFIPIFVMLAKQLNPKYLNARDKPMTKPKRREFVINESKALAQENQREILSYLKQKQGAGSVIDIVSLWATNTICLKAKSEVISAIAQRHDVWQVGYSAPLQIIGVEEVEEPTYKKVEFIPEDGREICWGVAQINADHVWALGYTGAGIIVGSMDSGVNYNHTDLADHMWDGGAAYPNHGWDFVNNDNNPMDDNGHGTACAGIIAGDGTSGSNTGVAPDAQIMALKIYPGTNSEMGQALQFALENNADLLSCSIGWSDPSNSIKNWNRGQSNILYAAGVIWCNAAGNGDGSGGHNPVPQDIIAPACCPGPWYAPNGGNGAVVAVGATNASDEIANFSSYGPTAWETSTYDDYPYPPGLMKPDVSAPGVNCKSLSHTNNTGYVDGLNGTSFAQPHHAGTVALLLSKEPLLIPQQIDSLIQNTAFDIEIAGRDSLSGAGRIDALAAVTNTEGTKFAQLWVINQAGANPGVLEVTNITKAQNQPWLIAASPANFYCYVDDSQDVRVAVDTTGQGLTWGQTYYDTLLIWSNATNVNPDRVPVILNMPTSGIAGSPYITEAEKSGNNAKFTWQTLSGADHYVVYRNTDPSFVPGHADSIGVTSDTFYTDVGVINSPSSFYYLVKGVGIGGAKSDKSNMAYKFNKSFNENPGATSDKNWMSLPWYSEYALVSDLTSDLSPGGDPLTGLTNLRDDQLYESWLYNPIFGWTGTDFSIVSGYGYEMVTEKDTSLVFVGANDPDGLVVLNENPDASDKNWISIPYNAAYSTVSDITVEYSSSGNPLTGLTNLRDDQLYESWLYNPIFGWTGTDFSIVPGRGYELVVISDTVWNPTEYTNEAKVLTKRRVTKKAKDVEVFCGCLTEPNRAPVWVLRNENHESGVKLSAPPGSRGQTDNKSVHPDTDTDLYELVSRRKLTAVSKTKCYRSACALPADREVGISHNVFVRLVPEDLDNIVFTAYRLNSPADVLTEQLIGCGVVKKHDQTGIWFNTGNFKKPWHHAEEIMLIIEATKKGKAYFNVLTFKLNKGVDMQNLGEIDLLPIPEPTFGQSSVYWDGIDDGNLIGYSLYQEDKRLNEKVITTNDYAAAGEVHIRPVIRGGYETVYANSKEQVQQSSTNKHIPLAFCFGVYPSPFTMRTQINYALPKSSAVEVVVYDVTGKQVKTLVSERLEPGYYKTTWQGDDEIGRKVSAGVYFILMNTKDFVSQRKVIFVR